MVTIGAIVLLVLLGIPLLAIFLLLLIVALRSLQLLCYGLAWICFGLGKLFEKRQRVTTAAVTSRGSSGAYVTQIYGDGETHGK